MTRRDARSRAPVLGVVLFVVLARVVDASTRDGATRGRFGVGKSSSSSSTWRDAAHAIARACANARARETCASDALVASVTSASRDAGAATCAARELARGGGETPDDGGDMSGGGKTLVTCENVGRTIGRVVRGSGGVNPLACGEAGDVACDGSCARGYFAEHFARAKTETTSGSVGVGLREACDGANYGSDAMYASCARGVGWAVTFRLEANETRGAWDACGDARDVSGVRSCRFGVVEAYVEKMLGNESSVTIGEGCESENLLGMGTGSNEAARARDACARALGAALAVRHEYDGSRSREECDLIADVRIKRACASAVDEELARREIDDNATVPFCERALETPVGEDVPSDGSSTPAPPPSEPVDQDEAEHRKEALRRHGTSVGGALWWACFSLLSGLVCVVTAYVWWRDGAFGPRHAVEYARVGTRDSPRASTELGAL